MQSIQPSPKPASTVPLTDLLPSSTLATLMSSKEARKNALVALQLVTTISLSAIEQFQNGNLSSFDALIGNHSCHTVAAYCLELWNQANHRTDFAKQIEQAKSKLNSLRMRLLQIRPDISFNEGNNSTFESYIHKHGLYVSLNPDLIYLVMAYGSCLTRKRASKNLSSIDPYSIIDHFKNLVRGIITNKLCQKLIKHWQRKLSEFLVSFLHKEVGRLSSENSAWGKYVKAPYVIKDPIGRLCTPNLHSMRIVFHRLQEQPDSLLAIRLHLFTDDLIYVGSSVQFYQADGRMLSPITINKVKTLPSDKGVLVADGCCHNSLETQTSSAKRLSSWNVLDAIFANDIHYPHYPTSTDIKNVENKESSIKEELDRLKSLKGFSLEDPRLFCLRHMYPDTLKNQLESMVQTPSYLPSHNYHNVNEYCR